MSLKKENLPTILNILCDYNTKIIGSFYLRYYREVNLSRHCFLNPPETLKNRKKPGGKEKTSDMRWIKAYWHDH